MLIENEHGIDEDLKEALEGKKKKREKRKIKKAPIIITIFIVVLGVVIGAANPIATYFINLFNKKKTNKNPDLNKDNTPKETRMVSLEDLGAKIDFEEQKEENYGSSEFGKVDPKKVVKDESGIIWKDNEAKEESSQVGTVITDTKEGTLKVEKDGTVVTTTDGYEIKDEKTGEIISSGEGIPSESNTDKYVVIDENYYDKLTGELRLPKGGLIEKEKLEEAKKVFTTVPPVSTQVEDHKVEELIEEPVEEGKYNENGTYSIYGLTFESKADFEQWVFNDGAGYVLGADGIIRALENQQNYQKIR